MNVAPVYYGLDNGGRPPFMELVCAPPARLNAMLAGGEIAISPVSSAAYARHPQEWVLLPDLSISCVGEVMSVLLVSRYRFAELCRKPVLLTEESATAAALTRLLFSLQGVAPVFETGRVRRISHIGPEIAAALVIGDAALREHWSRYFPHVWDLGEMWWELTELPFVFALWAVRRDFAQSAPALIAQVSRYFAVSKQQGYQHLNAIAFKAARKLGLSLETGIRYYQKLYHDLDGLKLKGLTTFFDKLHTQGLIPEPVRPEFFHIEP
jgi:chorismate dehydratase